MCSTPSRRTVCEAIPETRSVPGPGICPAYPSRESSGYRSLSSRSEQKAPPYGNSGSDIPEHTGRCQRTTRLENPRRLCPITDQDCTALSMRKRIWDSISTIPFTLSTHPRSISASPFSLGRCSAPPSQRSNSIRCWICEEIFRPSSISQTESFMMSMFLTFSFLS